MQSYLPTLYTNSNSNTQNIADIEAVLKILLRQLNDGMESLTSPSLYDLIEGIHEQLVPAESSFDLTLNDMIFTILYRLFGNTTIGDGDLLSDIRSIMSQNGLIASYLNTINSNTVNYTSVLNSIDSKTKDYTTYFNTQIARLDHLELIDWQILASTDRTDIITFINNVETSEVATGNSYSGTNLFEMQYTISSPNGLYIDFETSARLNSTVHDYDLTGIYLNSSIPLQYQYIYKYIDNNYRVHFIVKLVEAIQVNQWVRIRFTTTGSVRIVSLPVNYHFTAKYLPFDSLDYQVMDIALNTSNNHDILSAFKEIYASDKELEARKASQQVIDQTLDDFTGSGSASVKVNDISSAKDVSNALRSGLNTGGSSSDVLSIFTPSNSFWGWFSEDNAQYFTPLTDNRLLRSYNTESLITNIPDYQSYNDQLYFDYVNGGVR